MTSRKPQKPAPAPSPRSRPVAGTRRAPAAVITDSMQIYIDSLPRGERGKARNVMSAYRNFGNMEPSEAIARYKQRKSDDARTPLDNAGEFEDELGTDDESDFEEPATGGALTMQMSGLMSNDEFTQSHPELTARLRARAGGMSRRDEIAARRAELVAAGNSEEAARAIEAAERERIATAATQQYRRGDVWRGLAKGSQPVANPETPPGSPTGAGRSEALTRSFGGEGDGSRESTVPVHNLLYAEQRVLGAPDARVAMQRAQTREQDQARVRDAQRRAQQEWEEVMTASRAAQRQAAHSVDLTGSTVPFPDHDSDAVVSG